MFVAHKEEHEDQREKQVVRLCGERPDNALHPSEHRLDGRVAEELGRRAVELVGGGRNHARIDAGAERVEQGPDVGQRNRRELSERDGDEQRENRDEGQDDDEHRQPGGHAR